ncbi:hypothetical protein V6N12_033952 [Hibiscus sabdariffa]|uniref:Uncharacterized protein n=1 Tax=Hibiscus sabdariffa TaxID=183260 RepID=A0ABR2A7P4_9ROSI
MGMVFLFLLFVGKFESIVVFDENFRNGDDFMERCTHLSKDYVTGRENCLQMDYDLVGQSVALTFYWQHPQLGLIKASVDGACSIPESSCSR